MSGSAGSRSGTRRMLLAILAAVATALVLWRLRAAQEEPRVPAGDAPRSETDESLPDEEKPLAALRTNGRRPSGN